MLVLSNVNCKCVNANIIWCCRMSRARVNFVPPQLLDRGEAEAGPSEEGARGSSAPAQGRPALNICSALYKLFITTYHSSESGLIGYREPCGSAGRAAPCPVPTNGRGCDRLGASVENEGPRDRTRVRSLLMIVIVIVVILLITL